VSREIRAIPVKVIANVDAWRSRSTPPQMARVDASSPALVTFTTGSTGAPKGARRSHRFLVAQHRSLVESFGTSHGDIDYPLLPIFVLNNLAAGATTVLPVVDPRRVDAFDPAAVVRQMTLQRVSTTTGSPAFYARLAEHCIEHRVTLPDLQRIFLGGAPVGARLAKRLVEAFPTTHVTIVYGSTEAEPISMINARAMLERVEEGHRGLPVGRPVASIDMLILPIADGAIAAASDGGLHRMALPPGETGEICVAGDHVLDQYYGERSTWMRSKIAAGGRLWHRTGDGGYLGVDGELFLMGRVKQSFERAGRRTFVLPVEERLAGIDGVRAGTIMLVDGRATIVVEPSGDRDAIERDIRESHVDHDDLRFIEQIPRDPRHRSKIDYDRLREHLDGE
jgi:olefin beta-lactone synthetase